MLFDGLHVSDEAYSGILTVVFKLLVPIHYMKSGAAYREAIYLVESQYYRVVNKHLLI